MTHGNHKSYFSFIMFFVLLFDLFFTINLAKEDKNKNINPPQFFLLSLTKTSSVFIGCGAILLKGSVYLFRTVKVS